MSEVASRELVNLGAQALSTVAAVLCYSHLLGGNLGFTWQVLKLKNKIFQVVKNPDF